MASDGRMRERLRSPAHDTALAARRHTVLRSLRVRLLKTQPLEHTPCPGCHRTCTPVCPTRPRTAASERCRSNNAQTPGKTRHHKGPEDEARHHARRCCTVCKTSIPGSNPGGASIFSREFDRPAPPTSRSAPTTVLEYSRLTAIAANRRSVRRLNRLYLWVGQTARMEIQRPTPFGSAHLRPRDEPSGNENKASSVRIPNTQPIRSTFGLAHLAGPHGFGRAAPHALRRSVVAGANPLCG
jgi:hypothetical protein